MPPARQLVLLLGALVAAGCSAAGAGGPPRRSPAELPRQAGSFAPSQVRFEGPRPPAGRRLADAETCGQCHTDVWAQWRTSAHSFASFNNPVYRAVFDRFRRTVGHGPGRFCGGCHDIALLVDGALAGTVAPTDVRAHAGITCRTCHGIARMRVDGNGSYTLTAKPIPLPSDDDPGSLARHKARARLDPLRSAVLCASCHRSFLGPATGNPHYLGGIDEPGDWMRTGYAGSRASRVDRPLPRRDCRGCHMPRVAAPRGDPAARRGKIASHRFLGAHTWLARMRGDRAQEDRVVRHLRGAASIDITAAVRPDGRRLWLPSLAAPQPGEPLLVDVVVRNLRVGHRFPGGVLDAQDVWIELVTHDARGVLLAEAGTRQERTGGDRTAHRLAAALVDEGGRPVLARETERFRARAWNRTVGPRDAVVVRYLLELPLGLEAKQLPLRLTARLRHRTRGLVLQRDACRASRTPRGRAFAREQRRLLGRVLDPCRPQPVVDVAVARVFLGPGAGARPSLTSGPAWRRRYEHALGWSHSSQEWLDEARPGLRSALALLGSGPRWRRAAVLSLLGEIAGRQGRVEEAVGWLARAGRLAPGHPALARIRGDAYAAVWRWAEAIPPRMEVAQAAPLDYQAWANLAGALGSLGYWEASARAARLGLRLQPRHEGLLRSQALALAGLGEVPRRVVSVAREAYLAHRAPDRAHVLGARCAARVPGCALERNPVHVHRMRVPRRGGAGGKR